MIRGAAGGRLAMGLAFVAVYAAFDVLTLVRPQFDLDVAPWEPAPALILLGLFRGGRSFLPFALLAPFVAHLINPPLKLPWYGALLTSPILVLPFALTAELLARKVSFDPRLCRVADVLLLICATAVAAGLAAIGTIGVYVGLGVLPGEFAF